MVAAHKYKSDGGSGKRRERGTKTKEERADDESQEQEHQERPAQEATDMTRKKVELKRDKEVQI
eukprot:16277795-Heterocapsa_arctica.AAC.1